MNTNIDLDDELIAKAMSLGEIKTKKEAVNEALREFVERREQLKIFELFGTIDYDDDYDYKEQRRRQ